MRGIEALLLAGFIGLIGIGIWNARQWLPLRATQAAHSAPITSATTAASKPSALAGRKTEPKGTRVGIKPEHVRADQASASDVASGNDVVLADPSKPKTTEALVSWVVPTRKDLPVGATGVQIRSRFGDPTALVTETSDGRIVEQYYYFNRDRTQVTVATLRAGIIVSTKSTLP